MHTLTHHFQSIVVAAMAVCLLAAAEARGQHHHEGDIVLENIDQKIHTGHMHDHEGTEEFEEHYVFEALFGNEGAPNKTNTPGFDSHAGTWPVDSAMSLNIVDALRQWDGSDFDAISPLRVSVEHLVGDILTPETAGGFVPGPAVNTDDVGAWHQHYNWVLVDGEGAYPDGLYLLSLELSSDDPGIANSDPFYLVIAQDENLDDGGIGGHEQHEEAIEYVESNIVPEPGTVGLLAIALTCVAIGVRTRRRRNG